MAEGNLKSKTIKGTIWSSIERFSVQAIQFVVMIFMARILTPADYGIVGMVTIFIAVSQTLIDSGFSQSLIRKQDRNEIDNSTVFYFNIGVGIILYFTLFFCARPIARFYDEPILVNVVRLISLSLPLNSLAVVQRALLTVKVDFKTQANASLAGALSTGAVGLSMAYTGYGVWSLVWAQLAGTLVNVVVLWIVAKWRPVLSYSWKSFKELFGFGSKLLISGIIDTLYKNLYLIVIGKVFKASDLGFYTRARNFSDFASSNITGVLQRVTFPILCTIQDEDARLREAYRKFLKISAFIIFPLMTGMAGVAKPMVVSILTEKWLYASVLLVPVCLGCMWYPIHAINLNLLTVKGRSDLFLKLEIIKKITGVCIIAGSIPLGIYWMCWGMVVQSLIALLINTHYTGKLIDLGFIAQMKDLFPTLLLSLGMGVGVWALVTFVQMPPGGALAAGIGTGIIIYCFFARLLHLKEFSELCNIVKRHGK